MRTISDEYIASCWDKIWTDLENEFGSSFTIPIDDRNIASEKLRALNVLQLWQREGGTSSLRSFLSSYSVSDAAATWLIENHAKGAVPKSDESRGTSRPVKRKDKWSAFIKWAKDNAGKEFTTEQLVEQSGFSYPATLTFVKNEPLFVKVKKGLWKVSTASSSDES